MTDSQNSATVTTQGKLCVWRVFELARDYHDRPQNDSANFEFSTPLRAASGTDQLRIIIGTFPEIIHRSLREVRARGPFMLNELFVGAYQGKSAHEKENILEELYSETNLDDINIGSSLYLTLEASRPLEIDIHPDFRFLWGQDAKPLDAQVFSSFADEAGPRLDLALGWLLPVLEPRWQLRRLAVGGNRAILIVPDKAAIWIPNITGSAVAGVVSSQTWEEQNWQELEQRAAAFTSRNPTVDSLVAGPSRWLTLALAEKDSLRKFLFAFFGLEILANKFLSRSRDLLIKSLGQNLASVPVDELLWPKIPDENAPQRNLVFAFAAMSTLICADTATEDTKHFRGLAKLRNTLAHGDAGDLSSLPGAEAVALLTKYISAVAVRNE